MYTKILHVSLVVLGVFCCGCETSVVNRGHVGFERFDNIHVNKDDMNRIYERFGAPTIKSTIVSEDGCVSWYYISKRVEKTSFLSEKVVDNKTVRITFDKNGIVRSVKESSYENPIPYSSETTKTDGNTHGIMKETFGGMGKYLDRYSDADKK